METSTPTTNSATDSVPASVKGLVLYDGECSLCNRSVLTLLRIDSRHNLAYASQKSDFAKRLAAEGVVSGKVLENSSTMLFVENPGRDARVFLRSSAGIRAGAAAGGVWKLALAFLLVPRFLRDGLYDFIARNRYHWFGRRDESVCRILTLEERCCFLD